MRGERGGIEAATLVVDLDGDEVRLEIAAPGDRPALRVRLAALGVDGVGERLRHREAQVVDAGTRKLGTGLGDQGHDGADHRQELRAGRDLELDVVAHAPVPYSRAPL